MSDHRDVGPDTELVDGWPAKARLGALVEASTGLCQLAGLLGLVVVVIGGQRMPAWMHGVSLVLLLGGVSCALVIGGLLLAFWPRAMAGTLLETAVIVSSATRRMAGLIFAWTGAWVGIGGLLVWAINADQLDLQAPPLLVVAGLLAVGAPFLMWALEIPPIGGRRRRRATSQRQQDLP